MLLSRLRILSSLKISRAIKLFLSFGSLIFFPSSKVESHSKKIVGRRFCSASRVSQPTPKTRGPLLATSFSDPGILWRMPQIFLRPTHWGLWHPNVDCNPPMEIQPFPSDFKLTILHYFKPSFGRSFLGTEHITSHLVWSLILSALDGIKIGQINFFGIRGLRIPIFCREKPS